MNATYAGILHVYIVHEGVLKTREWKDTEGAMAPYDRRNSNERIIISETSNFVVCRETVENGVNDNLVGHVFEVDPMPTEGMLDVVIVFFVLQKPVQNIIKRPEALAQDMSPRRHGGRVDRKRRGYQ